MLKFLKWFVAFQKKYAVLFVLFVFVLTAFVAPYGVKLLTKVSTELARLLPDEYPTIRMQDATGKKFQSSHNLFLVISSPDPDANLKASLYAKEQLLTLASVDSVKNEKPGYDFFNKNKLLLVDLEDLYRVRDRIEDKIQKEKLDGFYIDLEEEENAKENGNDSFKNITQEYNNKFMVGMKTRYHANENGTVYFLAIHPKNPDTGLSFFKSFGQEINQFVAGLDLKKFHPQIEIDYASSIKTRVDEYNALMGDLKVAGLISGISIFLVLFIYFRRLTAVLLVFLPMLLSTLLAFSFCSLFFTHLNVVTSFLFSILFGLGVDIGIHLLSRYMQDRKAGLSIETAYYNTVVKTGKSAVTGIMTTVASFYVLTVIDFKGFSDFGWIAGNGLVIALLTYLIFFPPMLLLADKYKLLKFPDVKIDNTDTVHLGEKRFIPYAPVFLLIAFIIFGGASLGTNNLDFEWDFRKLKMQIPQTVAVKEKVKDIVGRVNSPALYLVESESESRKIKSVLDEKRLNNKNQTTVQYVRSYSDMMPRNQEEKLAVLYQIKELLADDALNTLPQDDLDLIAQLQKDIEATKLIKNDDVPKEIHDLFFGNKGDVSSSVVYVQPLNNLELDHGENAIKFAQEVSRLHLFDKNYFAISDAIVFADVLETLFRDSKTAILLSTLLLVAVITIHFRNIRRIAVTLAGLAFGIVTMLGLMDLFNLKLNFYNMIIIPAMIGMGEDNSVHVIHRYDEIGQRSLIEALKTSGGAAFMASFTTILGYAGLCFAHHPGLNSIGWMAVIGMTTCLIGSLVVLPLLIQVFIKRKI